MIPVKESGTSRTKHAANCPLALPAFTRHGVFGTNSRSSITSLIAAKNLSLLSASLSAAETWPTTRRTISVHSSIALPFESFSEYRRLITRLALRPSGCDFRLGETVGELVAFRPFLPIAALIFSAFSRGRPCEGHSGLKNGSATRTNSRVPLTKIVGADTPVGSIRSENSHLERAKEPRLYSKSPRLVSSGAEYTPLPAPCQYIVAIFFLNAIECAI